MEKLIWIVAYLCLGRAKQLQDMREEELQQKHLKLG